MRWFHWKILPIIWRSSHTKHLLKLFQKTEGGNTSPLSLWGHHHADTKPNTLRGDQRPVSLLNADAKFLNKTLTNRTQEQRKRRTHLSKQNLFEKGKDRPTYKTHPQTPPLQWNEGEENNKTVSLDEEKALDKTQRPVVTETLNNGLGTEGVLVCSGYGDKVPEPGQVSNNKNALLTALGEGSCHREGGLSSQSRSPTSHRAFTGHKELEGSVGSLSQKH